MLLTLKMEEGGFEPRNASFGSLKMQGNRFSPGTSKKVFSPVNTLILVQ